MNRLGVVIAREQGLKLCPSCELYFAGEGRYCADCAPAKPMPRLCAFCGAEFTPKHKAARYCSPAHRQHAYHNRKQGGSSVAPSVS